MRLVGSILRVLRLQRAALPVAPAPPPPADPRLIDWPEALAPRASERDFGLVLAELLVKQADWVFRRVEAIEFVDDRRLSRRMSVDFVLPVHRADVLRHGDSWLVPVRTLRKRPLHDFDLRSADGRAIPVATRRENTAYSTALLTSILSALLLADRRTGEVERESIEDFARDVVSSTPDKPRVPVVSGAEGVAGQIPDMPATHGVIATFEDQFLLVAHAPVTPGARDLIKMRFEDEVELFGSRVRKGSRLLQGLGLSAIGVEIACPVRNQASTCHVEVLAPPGCIIVFAGLSRKTDYSSKAWVRTRTHSYIEALADDVKNAERAHLLYNHGSAPRARKPRFRRRNAPPPKGAEIHTPSEILQVRFRLLPETLMPSLWISLFMTLVLGAGLILHMHKVTETAGDTVALLVVLPAVFVGYLVPSGHPMVKRMYAALRATVFVAAVSSFGAAATLVLTLRHRYHVLGYAESLRVWVWAVLFMVTLLCTLLVAVDLSLSYRARPAPTSFTAALPDEKGSNGEPVARR